VSAQHTPTPMTAGALRSLRAKHAVRLMESGETVNSLLDHIDWLAAKFSLEENEHAELQSRCFEGFPSVSEGIFDAYKAASNSHDALVAALRRYGKHDGDCRSAKECDCGFSAALKAAKGAT
jgi:hypothetical protein